MMGSTKSYQIIGLMSGSSLDGLDIAFCRFEVSTEQGVFKVDRWEMPAAETVAYSGLWKMKLQGIAIRQCL